MSNDIPADGERLFLRPNSATLKGTLLAFAGVGGLCVAAVGFALSVFGRTGPLGLHAMSTFPAILSVAALTASWTILRTPRRVGVGPAGLVVETRYGDRLYRWDEVGCAAVETAGASHRKRLNVTGPDGRSIVKLDESFERFDELVALVSGFVDAKGDDTADRIRHKKARRQAALAFVLGLLMATACGFVGWSTYEDQRAARLLRERGELGVAEVVRRFVAPNGVTKRIEYRAVGTGGRSATRNVEVRPAYWDRLEGAKTVLVMFVRDEPGASRLLYGEVKDDDFTKTPAGGYTLTAVGGAFALFLLGISPLMWNGWDLAHDSKTRKWSLKRYGKVVWSSGGPPTNPGHGS